MLNELKFSSINIDKENLSYELSSKAKYYANVIHWTLIFALPLFWLIDFIFLSTDWLVLFVVRLIVAFFSQCIYVYGGLRHKNWRIELVMSFIIGLNTLLYATICSCVSISFCLPYFLLFSVFFLLFNITIFWKPVYSIVQCGVSYLVIMAMFASFNRYDGYDALIAHGGGIFFVLSAFSCLIGYNRYLLGKREIEKNILIEKANNRMLEQNEKIFDQQQEIKEVNRKLKRLSEYRFETMSIMLHDFRNFTGSIQMSLDLLKQSDSNLNEEQQEILGYIGVGNDKLKYLSEKLASSAQAEAKQIDYNYEQIDLGKAVEQMTMDIADAAAMKQINLQLNIDPSSTIVQLDKIFLDQVLNKLLSNIIRYSSVGTIVTIHLHRNADNAIVDFANKGKLLGSKKLAQLFSGLDDVKDTNDIFSQNTAGFSVAKKLTEQMGGKLTYNSEESIGNFYRLEFNLSRK